MRLLLTLGTIFDAERMIPVSSCHIGGRSFLISGQENIDWMTELYEGGARFQVFTSTNIPVPAISNYGEKWGFLKRS